MKRMMKAFKIYRIPSSEHFAFWSGEEKGKGIGSLFNEIPAKILGKIWLFRP
jgi:hypothetical protein